MSTPLLPSLFKGIALFTPAGDLVYSIDPNKQGHWHANLCSYLQELLNLPEPPHFLLPGYTATIDRWFDPQTHQVRTLAELYPPVRQHQDFLNAVFMTPDLHWHTLPWQEDTCEPQILESYRDRFPQLWETHELLAQCDRSDPARLEAAYELAAPAGRATNASYVLHLYVAGHTELTEQTLQRLHTLLENTLPYTYTLKVIDIFQHPEQAERNHITATPTLLRVLPAPRRRIVGELNDPHRLLQILAAR